MAHLKTFRTASASPSYQKRPKDMNKLSKHYCTVLDIFSRDSFFGCLMFLLKCSYMRDLDDTSSGLLKSLQKQWVVMVRYFSQHMPDILFIFARSRPFRFAATTAIFTNCIFITYSQGICAMFLYYSSLSWKWVPDRVCKSFSGSFSLKLFESLN